MSINTYRIEYKTIDPETSMTATGNDNFYTDTEEKAIAQCKNVHGRYDDSVEIISIQNKGRLF